MHCIDRTSADAVVRMVFEKMFPCQLKKTGRIFGAQRFAGEGAEGFRPETKFIFAKSVALLEMDSAGITAGNQPLLINRGRVSTGIAEFASNNGIYLRLSTGNF